MGREIENILDILNFYKVLGFKELPEVFLSSLLKGEKTQNTHSKDKLDKTLTALNEEIRICKKCILSKERTQAVCGEGNANAKLMFIGEAPGVDEDRQGRPFVGEAGNLLTSLIEKMGFKRQEVYITNTVKCHPPGNRDPLEEEVSLCFDYLKREIEIISPKVIITLGKVATYTLMGMKGKIKDIAISKIRGNVFLYKNIPVIPTFHPAYLLRNRKDKWLTWEDAQEALRRLK
ncbi:MAG: uracil-DNA glycosylase [Thermodesulfovibrio sp.]|nr:uracil-DNA glycosylase [Thermodesulfovibrio sp.]